MKNTSQRHAVYQLNQKYKDLKGNEKIDAMKQNADEILDALNRAIEELEKDIEFNPRQFLGVALYPDQLLQGLAFLGTLALGML